MKVEMSGWPKHVKTDEDKLKFIEKYEEREEIKLDQNQIEDNPGRRQQAKLMLNSLWGKVSSILLSYFLKND